MIKVILLLGFAFGIASVRSEPEVSESRELQYPDYPYFHSVVYPFGWGWGIAAYVLLVFKAVYLFTAFAIWSFYEQGFTRRYDKAGSAREIDYWSQSVLKYLIPSEDNSSSSSSSECQRQILCEAEAYQTRNPLLRLLAQLGGAAGQSSAREIDCSTVVTNSGCASMTIEQMIWRNIGRIGGFNSRDVS